jgi:cardiolipin synthase A/B
VQDGHDANFALEVSSQLAFQKHGTEAQGEIVKGAMQGLRDGGHGLDDEGTRLYVRHLARQGEVDETEAIVPHAPVEGNRSEILMDGKEAFPRIIEDMKNAKSSINIHEYGFVKGKLATELANVMIDKAKSGVDVRISTERTAVESGSPELFKKMIAAGVKVVTNDSLAPNDADGVEGARKHQGLPIPHLPGALDKATTVARNAVGVATSDEFLHPDHRKMFIIDGKTAYTGGMGVNDTFATKTHDVMVRLQGPVVAQEQADFLATYKMRGGDIPSDLKGFNKLFPEQPVYKDGAKMTSLTNIPGPSWRPVTKAYLDQIANAKSEIQVANPYIGDDKVMNALKDAAQRGVKVTMVVPKYPEHIFAELNQKYDVEGLVKAGVDVREFQRENFHPKVMVVDGKNTLVGSANLDGASMNRNLEHDVLIEDSRTADRFRDSIFARELSLSKSVPARRAEPEGSKLDQLKERAKRKVGDIADDLLGHI